MAYKYLGYGITNEQGIATLDHDANGDPITHSYTGTGAGEIDIVASLDDNTHISESSIQSETYSILDTITYEDEILSDKTWDILLNDCDYHVEFKVCPTSRTSSFAYIQIGADTTHRIQLGHLFSNGQSGIRVMNGTTVVSSQFGVQPYPPLDTDTLITCDKIGNTYSVNIGDQTLPLVTETAVTDTKLLNALISNDSIKDFKIWML